MRPRNNALRAEVMRLKQTGISQAEIARLVGKSTARVSRLLRRGAEPVPAPAVNQEERSRRAVAASAAYFDNQETDIRLDLALRAPEDLSAYQDCIDAARWQGSLRRRGEPSPMGQS